jgi:hypothetical protein
MKGRGLKLWVKLTTEPEGSFVRISPVKTYSPGEESVGTSEKTYLDQDHDYTDHSTGLIDPGEVAVGVEYDPADAGQILIEANLAKRLDFKAEWRDGSGETYTGAVTKRGFSEPGEEDLMRNYSVKRSGSPVQFTAP